MHGDVAKAAKWLALGMVLSTLILVVGAFCIVHGDRLLNRCDWLTAPPPAAPAGGPPAAF